MSDALLDPVGAGGDPGQGDAPAGAGADPNAGRTTEPTTLADGASADDGKEPAAPASWPGDWREKMAGKDEGFLKTLKRYGSPEAYAKAGYQAQSRIRAGEAKRPLPENPSDEDLATWRKDNGIPEKPEGYEIKTENGYVFGDADKPILDSFKTFVHGRNWTPQQVNDGAQWYAELAEQQAAQQQQNDAKFRESAMDTLREEWGPEYRRNLTAVQNTLASHADPEFAAQLLGGRTADGQMIGNHPSFLRFMTQLALDANPLARVVPAGVADQGKAINDEIASIEKLMKANDPGYWQDQKVQARYQELLAAQNAAQSKGR